MSRTRVRNSWRSLRPWQRHAITGALVVALIALCVVVRNATVPDEATAQVPVAAPPGDLPAAPDAKPDAPSNVAAIVNDVISEASESFDLNLGNAFVTPNITLGRAATTVTITDNDVPGVTVSQSGGTTTVTEGVGYEVRLPGTQPTQRLVYDCAGCLLSPSPTPRDS